MKALSLRQELAAMSEYTGIAVSDFTTAENPYF